MSGMMPINEGPNISSVLLLAVPPMWSNCSDPVDLRVRGAGESSVRLSIEPALKSWNSILPMLGIFILTIRTDRKVSGAVDIFTPR